MTLQEAEEILKDWKADFTWHNHVNCKDEAKCNGVETRDCAVEALLEAQKVIERQRAIEYLQKICWSKEDIEAFLNWNN